jgi:hypothetical protein
MRNETENEAQVSDEENDEPFKKFQSAIQPTLLISQDVKFQTLQLSQKKISSGY